MTTHWTNDRRRKFYYKEHDYIVIKFVTYRTIPYQVFVWNKVGDRLFRWTDKHEPDIREAGHAEEIFLDLCEIVEEVTGVKGVET